MDIIGVDLTPLGLAAVLHREGASEDIRDALGRRFLPGTSADLAESFVRLSNAVAHSLQRDVDIILVVPEYFDDAQRLAWRSAAQAAGFTVRRLINRPTAALLGSTVDIDAEDEHHYLVGHVGASSACASIVCTRDSITEIESTSGPIAFSGPAEANAALSEAVRQCIASASTPHDLLGALCTGHAPETLEGRQLALAAAPALPWIPVDTPLALCAQGAALIGALLGAPCGEMISLTVTDFPYGIEDTDGSYLGLVQRNSTQPLCKRLPFTLTDASLQTLTVRPACASPDGGHIVLGEVHLPLPAPAADGTRSLTLMWEMSWEGTLSIRLLGPEGVVGTETTLDPRVVLGEARYQTLAEGWCGLPDPPVAV